MSTNMVKLFVSKLRDNFNAWHDGDIDYATLNEHQRATWTAIHLMGPETEAAVMRELSGSAVIAERSRLPSGCRGNGTFRSAYRGRDYRAHIARTLAGSPTLRLSTANPQSEAAGHRRMAALVYELAANLERLSEVVEAHWAIVADPNNGCVVVELAGDHDAELAYHLLAEIMLQNDLT